MSDKIEIGDNLGCSLVLVIAMLCATTAVWIINRPAHDRADTPKTEAPK